MSKEEFLKIQTCVLKVNIHCDGCKQKVKKILQKIDGVFTIKIDSDTGKVTVSGNADPDLLIKKLNKAGKHAELWGSQKPNNNNQNHLNLTNQFKNMHLDGRKGGGGGGGGNNKGQKGGGGGNNQQHHPNQLKGGPQGLTPQQQHQLQQLQHQMKGFQDLKLPQFNNLKMPLPDQPPSSGGKPSAMSFRDDDELDDDDFDDEYDDDDEFDYDDDEFDDMDEVHHPVNKMKPGMGNGPGPNMMMPGMMKVGNGGGGGGNSGKKGGGPGGGAIPVQIAGGNNGNGKKGGGGGGEGGGGGSSGGNHQIQGGGGGGKNGGGKSGGMPSSGGMPDKNGNHGGGGPMVNGNGGGGKKSGGNSGGAPPFMENGFPQMGGNLKMPMGGQMGNMPMSQMVNLQAVNGLPAASMAGGGGGSDAYYRGPGLDVMPGNSHQQQQQQQYLAAVMNQQRASGTERFQPLMYARPPPAVNYIPAPAPAPYPAQYPYPQYPYPYPQQGGDPYSYYFSEENPSSCNVM